MIDSPVENLEPRLVALERQVRVWRLVSAVSAGIVAVALLAGSSAPDHVTDVIKAKAFSVLSEDGETRASLTATADGAALTLSGSNKSALKISVEDSRPSLVLQDVKGKSRVALELDSLGAPSLVLADDRVPRARLDAQADVAGITIFGPDGTKRSCYSASPLNGDLSMFDGEGNRALRLVTGSDGAAIHLYRGEKSRIRLMLGAGQGPRIELLDAKFVPRAVLGATQASEDGVAGRGEASLMLNDENGRPVWLAPK